MAVKKKEKIVISKAKRKKSIARARIKKGKGNLRINSKPIELYFSFLERKEIFQIITLAKRVLKEGFMEDIDVSVNVRGGGLMGQAQSCKVAIAKAFVKWFDNDKLKEVYLGYDRALLVDDVRRREPKKPLRKGARAKYQKSYRWLDGDSNKMFYMR